MPYAEVWRVAVEGGNLLARIDPISLAGGLSLCVLVLIGGVFVAEAASVILQVGWFKWRRRRIFLCAPLHHHFQFRGWPESKIVVRFIRRRAKGSNGSRRCIVKPLSHNSASPTCQWWQ